MAVIKQSSFSQSVLEGISRCLSDVMTNPELEYLLTQNKLSPQPPSTKWIRLFNSFIQFQNQHQCSNSVLHFIKSTFQPARFIGKESEFHESRNNINKYLSLSGFEVLENGNIAKTSKTTTVSEAEAKAHRLKYLLERRNVHQQIFLYCKAELLVENYFHSVFEAMKSIADRIRSLTGLSLDGIQLIDQAFSITNPMIRINGLQSDTDYSEDKGYANYIRGLFGLIRNPIAHEPKIKFIIKEDEALDIFSSISYVHKRLDRSIT